MKGIVFREFITMVETQFSLETADAIIADSTLATGGAYTTVGTYPHEEMVELVSHLSTRTAIAIPDLLRAFGHYLFQRFTVIHADYITDHTSALSVLRMLRCASFTATLSCRPLITKNKTTAAWY